MFLLCFGKIHTAVPQFLLAAFLTQFQPSEWSGPFGFCWFLVWSFVLQFFSWLALHFFFPVVVNGLKKDKPTGFESLKSLCIAS